MGKKIFQLTLDLKHIRRVVSPRNILNDLDGKEWVKFTKSWFVGDGEFGKYHKYHPAPFPPNIIEDFINFFSKKDEWILDPFVGIGSTLVACDRLKRRGVGIELYNKWIKIAEKRTKQKIYQGNIFNVIPILEKQEERFKLVVTSPPYWKILTIPSESSKHIQKERDDQKLSLKYGDDYSNDLGLIEEYDDFVKEIANVFIRIKPLLINKSHLIIIVQNFYYKGRVYSYAFDLANLLKDAYTYLGERVWCQDHKTLRPYGYPIIYVPNMHHHYCLIFRMDG